MLNYSTGYSIFRMNMNKAKLGTGLLVFMISIISDHYFKMPDFLTGALEGFAIGIMILAFIKIPPRQKTSD